MGSQWYTQRWYAIFLAMSTIYVGDPSLLILLRTIYFLRFVDSPFIMRSVGWFGQFLIETWAISVLEIATKSG